MGLCLGTEEEDSYEVPHSQASTMGNKQSVEKTRVKPGIQVPINVAITPVTPTLPDHKQTTHKQDNFETTTTTGPTLFHFAFDTLKGESRTDTLLVTPDLLQKSLDLLPPKPQDVARLGTETSNVSRISALSQQSCDTISIRSELSRHGSGASNVSTSEKKEEVSHGILRRRTDMAKSMAKSNQYSAVSIDLTAHELTMRSSSVPSNRASSITVSSDRRSTMSGAKRESMLADAPVVKDFMKSRLTVRQDSSQSTLSRDVLQWKRGNCLGRGSFGTVYLGLTDTGELIAVKHLVVNLVDENELQAEYAKIYREVEIIKHLKHKNIVQYLGSSFENNTISIFTQYVSGGSLSSLLHQFGPLGECITSKYTKQLLSAIVYMHENKVVHRDIKSGNIMMTPEGVVKLIDFGCARKLAIRASMSGSHMMRSWKGTPYWMAPEVIHETGHGKKSDIWSLGCTVFEMLTGLPPWGDREPIAAIYAIGCEDVPMPTLDDMFSTKAKEFVNKCLNKDKFRRPAAAALQLHAFIYPGIDRQLSETCSEDSKWVETL